MLHAHKDETITYKTTNPFAPDKRDLFFVSDPPHLIKLLGIVGQAARVMWVSEQYMHYS